MRYEITIGWLEYFTRGLSTQLAEVKQRGERAIRRDVIVHKHGLSERQAKVVAFLLEHDGLTIQDYEGLCPDVNRRTLQRDLKDLIEKELLIEQATGPTDPTKRYMSHIGGAL